MSCKSSVSATAKSLPADAPTIAGKQWRLAKETIAADSKEDYATGINALRSLDAFGTMEVSKLFFHHNLMMVPAGTRHWFDMGSAPEFAAIRFFEQADGWIGDFTGDPIGERFPTLDQLVTT